MKIPAVIGVSYSNHFTGTVRRALYEWYVQTARQLLAAPSTLTASSFKGYRRFDRARHQVEIEISGLRHFGVLHVPDGSNNPIVDATFDGWVMSQSPNDQRSEAGLLLMPSALGISENSAIDNCIRFAVIGVQRYGYVFLMAREDAPQLVVAGLTYGDKHERQPEEKANLAFWGVYWNLHENFYLLRDVYPVNFLSRPYLDLPVFDTTFETWIQQDPARGSLEPLPGNEAIAVWRPVAENIPAIREALFPSGVLFYYKFFQHWEPDNPWKRDFSKPFVAPGPTPEIFRADYYAGRDPRITR